MRERTRETADTTVVRDLTRDDGVNRILVFRFGNERVVVEKRINETRGRGKVCVCENDELHHGLILNKAGAGSWIHT